MQWGFAMNEHTHAQKTTHRTSKLTIDEADRLITRIVDGEATETDRKRFAALASAQGELRDELARQQRQMRLLAEGVGSLLDHAERSEPPSKPLEYRSLMSGSNQM